MRTSLQEKDTVTYRETDASEAPAAAEIEEIKDRFKAAFRWHPAGVSIITANSAHGPVGLTATSVSSVSLAPPALSFSLSALSTTAPEIRTADSVVVHLMDIAGEETAQRFATSGIDRFAETRWTHLPTGEPLLEDAASWFRGRIVKSVDIGGSTLSVVEILNAGGRGGPADLPDAADEQGAPLVYCNRTWHGLSSRSSLT